MAAVTIFVSVYLCGRHHLINRRLLPLLGEAVRAGRLVGGDSVKRVLGDLVVCNLKNLIKKININNYIYKSKK